MIYIALLAAGFHAVSYSAGHLRHAWQKTGQVLQKTITSLRSVPQMRRDFLDRTHGRRMKWVDRGLNCCVGGLTTGVGVAGFGSILGDIDREGALASQSTYARIHNGGLATMVAGGCAFLVGTVFLFPFATAALGAYAGLVGGAAAYATYQQKALAVKRKQRAY